MHSEKILTIINIILMITNLYIYQKEYIESKRKNITDIMPMFDVDISQLIFNVDFENKKVFFHFPLFNIGNGTATDIKTLDKNGLINNSIVAKYGNTYYRVEKNLAYNTNEVQFEVVFSDLNDIRYKQKFFFQFDISEYPKPNMYIFRSVFNPLTNNNLYIYLLNKKVEKIKKLLN